MRNKIIRAGKYIAYAICFNFIYGIIVYFIYAWLARRSPLHVYLGTLAMIIVALAGDEIMHKTFRLTMQSEKYNTQLMKEPLFRLYLDAFTSFKTLLYLFYILLLIISQIISFYPVALNENLENFIFANSYSIVLLIAVDQLIGQFSKDRERMKGISAEFKKYLDEDEA